MEIDYTPMGDGKTTRMLEWLKENQTNLLVVHRTQHVNNICQDTPNLRGRVITYNEFKRFPEKYSDCNVAIDQVDDIINDIFRGKVKRVSLTNDN